MSEYIQIGQTALRDPITGNFLPAVNLYIRKDDGPKTAALYDMPVAAVFAEKFRKYKEEMKALEKRKAKEKEGARE